MDIWSRKLMAFKVGRILFFIILYTNCKTSGTSVYPNYADSPYSRNYHTQQNESFDFIVIGSGPTGAVIANRLSEVPEWNVLLLEAGEQAIILSDVPGIAGWIGFTDLNWGYKAERQSGFCRGCMEQRAIWPHGKAVGGSTIINFMIHVRGNKLEYDRWAAMGNPGWAYDDVLPYFIKSEDSKVNIQDAGYHGSGGYLSVSDVPYRTESANVFVNAAQEAGLPYVDYNGKHQIGVSYVQAHLRNGRRCSAEKAFLRPVLNRPNLRILTGSRAVQILIDPETKRAYGVKFAKNKLYHYATAKKEVIVSSGGLNSPQLLMLSGIGPKNHLEELDIPVITDLPVGKKIYDHATFVGVTFQLNESIINQQNEIIANPIPPFIEFLTQGTGPITSLGGVEALAYFKTNISTDPDPSIPDVEFMFIGGGISTDNGVVFRRMFNIPQETYDIVWKPLENKYIYQVYPMLLHPQSYGYMELKSKNPFKWPKYYANYISDPYYHDIRQFILAIREMQRINASPSFQKYGATLVSIPIPGCENQIFDSDDYWACCLRQLMASLHHQISACKMGPAHDPEAVVDHKLRVHGIGNLRVADTSIIPLTLSAHTAAPSYMIGEKAADMIKEDWMSIQSR